MGPVKKTFPAFLAVSLFLAGCTTPTAMRKFIVEPETKLSSTPKSVILKSNVGEVMIARYNLRTVPGFVATNDYMFRNKDIATDFRTEDDSSGPYRKLINDAFRVRTRYELPLSGIEIRKGSLWACGHTTADNVCICSSEDAAKSQEMDYFRQNFNMHIDSGGKARMISDKEYTKTYDIHYGPAGLFAPTDVILKGSLKQELVYNGKSKDTIRMSYLEYVDDMARPSFFQELTYDLSESRLIAFRDIRMEVLEATNIGIRFVVK